MGLAMPFQYRIVAVSLPLKFLVIDDNADSRFLLVKTLLRKFPSAVIQECQEAGCAIESARHEGLAAIVTHRSTEIPGLKLVPLLREANPLVPIIMVSGANRRVEAIAAGADEFLLYDEWLRIGTVVAGLIRGRLDNDSDPDANPTESQPSSAN